MNQTMMLLKRLQAHLKLGVLVLGLMFSASAGAQQVLIGSQTGTIQELAQDDGYIIISGIRYDFDREVSEITLQGQEFDDADLSPGMVLRFTVERNMLRQIQVLGPASLLEGLDEH